MKKIETDIDSLCSLAFWLEGLKKGQGDLSPLGAICTDNLWKAIKELRDYQRDMKWIDKEFKKHWKKNNPIKKKKKKH